MCTRFVYNGNDMITGFNFDIDLAVWKHKVIKEKERFYRKENDGLPTLRKADTTPGKCAAWYKAGAKTAHADFAGG